MKRLVFVNRVYWPDEAATAQLLHDVATALARQEVPVTVITAQVRDRPARETLDGVDVRRVFPSAARSRGLFARGSNDALFLASAFAAVRQEVGPDDVVVAMTDPPMLGAAVTEAARPQGVRVWHWCQDVYPEVAMAVTRSRLARATLGLLTPLRDRGWRASDGCAVLGADMAALVAARGITKERIRLLPNWSILKERVEEQAVDAFRQRTGLAGKFVVMYSGNLGRVHVFEPLLDAARRLCAREDLVFVFVGTGPQHARVAAAAEAENLHNVRLLPPQPREALAASLSAADLHVVTLRPGCEGTVWPSKFYGIVAVGSPLLYIGPAPAEIAELVRTHALGGAFDPQDGEAIARFVVDLAGDARLQTTLRERVRTFAASLPGLAGAVAHWKRVASSEEP